MGRSVSILLSSVFLLITSHYTKLSSSPNTNTNNAACTSHRSHYHHHRSFAVQASHCHASRLLPTSSTRPLTHHNFFKKKTGWTPSRVCQLGHQKGAGSSATTTRVAPCRISLREARETQKPLGDGRRGKHRNPNRVPNNHWRAVPWEDLRQHPLVEGLPPAWEIDVESERDLSRIRRDSRRFRRVHHGRLTTFQLPALLGFFEPAASDYLRVKRPLANRHDKALGAREDLIASRAFELNKNLESYITLAQSLKFMDEELRAEVLAASEPQNAPRVDIWGQHLNPNTEYAQLFAKMYNPIPRAGEREIDPDLDLSIRFGEAQQATGVLTALNVLSKEGATIKETGLHVLEALQGDVNVSFPFPMGAAPDAMVKWPDGTEEPLSIKTVTPFEVYKGTDGFLRTRIDRNSRPTKLMTPWHIPQIQLNMLCTGAKRGWVLYMSSLNGARLFRVDRDQSYITAMSFWVRRFATLYGSRAPPSNFFLAEDYNNYRAFLTATKKLASRAFEHAFIKQRWVQRSPLNTPFFVGELEENELDEGNYDDFNDELQAQVEDVPQKSHGTASSSSSPSSSTSSPAAAATAAGGENETVAL